MAWPLVAGAGALALRLSAAARGIFSALRMTSGLGIRRAPIGASKATAEAVATSAARKSTMMWLGSKAGEAFVWSFTRLWHLKLPIKAKWIGLSVEGRTWVAINVPRIVIVSWMVGKGVSLIGSLVWEHMRFRSHSRIMGMSEGSSSTSPIVPRRNDDVEGMAFVAATGLTPADFGKLDERIATAILDDYLEVRLTADVNSPLGHFLMTKAV